MNEENLIVKLSELKKLANAIFDELEAVGWREVEIKEDHYWTFLGEERYRFTESMPELGVGQLYDDLEFLRTACAGQYLTPSHLENLAGLLNYIADFGSEALRVKS